MGFRSVGRACLVLMLSLPAFAKAKPAKQKETIVFSPPSAQEDDRPVATSILVGPQGIDYAVKLTFNKEPWGDGCKNRCANVTFFLDTDDDKKTGLQLTAPNAPETGADMSITVQGIRDVDEGQLKSKLRVKVKEFSGGAVSVEQGTTLAEMNPKSDAERVLSEGTTMYLLIDASSGALPTGKRTRVVYHPPDSKPLVGMAQGLAVPQASRVEIFKEGRLTNPPPPKKKGDYEKY